MVRGRATISPSLGGRGDPDWNASCLAAKREHGPRGLEREPKTGTRVIDDDPWGYWAVLIPIKVFSTSGRASVWVTWHWVQKYRFLLIVSRSTPLASR